MTLGRRKSVGEGASDNAPVGEKAVTCEEGGTRHGLNPLAGGDVARGR